MTTMLRINDFFREITRWWRSFRQPDKRQARMKAGEDRLSSTRERQRIVAGVRRFFEENYELR